MTHHYPDLAPAARRSTVRAARFEGVLAWPDSATSLVRALLATVAFVSGAAIMTAPAMAASSSSAATSSAATSTDQAAKPVTSANFADATGMKPLPRPVHVSICLFDPMGANGPIQQYAKDLVLEARKWNLYVEVKPYRDEVVAANDFKANQCDAVAISNLRAKQFNQYTGSFDAIGGLENYDQLKTALRVIHTNPKLTPLMINGSYEVAGLMPLGATYVMVRDRSISSIEKAAGKRIAVFDWDKSQQRIVQQIGAQPVSADFTSFGSKFNNGQVDIISAPAIIFQPLELYKGIGTTGAVFRMPVAMLTGALVFNRDHLLREVPDLDERIQRVREFMLSHIDEGFRMLVEMEKRSIPAKYWMDLPPNDKAKYIHMMRDARLQMTKDGIYDARMMSVLKKVRCHHDPSSYECSLNDE